jgi:hypothetical protein
VAVNVRGEGASTAGCLEEVGGRPGAARRMSDLRGRLRVIMTTCYAFRSPLVVVWPD